MRKLLRSSLRWQAMALVLLASIGRAEPPPEGARARLENSATKAVEQGFFADARNDWQRIWELEPDRLAACNVGQLSLRIGDMTRAAEFLTICVRDAPERVDPDMRDREEQRVLDLAEARQAVTTLTVRVRDGAELTLDGKPVGRAPLDRALFVMPGRHRIRAELNGEAGEVDIDATAGAERRVWIDLAPPPDKPRTWILVVGGISSGALLLGGAGLLVASGVGEGNAAERAADGRSLKNRCDERTHACYGASEGFETMAPLRDIGEGGILIGAAVAAGTLTYAFVPRGGGPALKVGTSGVLVEGTW
jgi:hypothetical protein